MRESRCHVCHERTPRGPTSRALCVRCAAAPSRSSVPELDELTRRSERPLEPPFELPLEERTSLELFLARDASLAAPIIDSSRPVLRWWALAPLVLVGALLAGAGTVAVDRAAKRGDAPALVTTLERVTGPSPVTEPSAPEPSIEPGIESGAIEPGPEFSRAVPPIAVPAPSPRPVVEEAPASEPTPALRLPARPARAAAAPTPPPATAALAPPAPAPALAPPPSRAAVRDAFLAIHDGVQQCGDVEHIGAVVVARIAFSGATGRVVAAQITDASVPPEVRSCVARVARGAELAPFAQERLTVTYPFRL